MKYEVTVGSLFIDGKKHRRGDVVEVKNAAPYGVRLQPVIEVEVEAPKPKRTRRKKAAE